MKFNISKAWCEAHLDLEEGHEIGAGVPPPPRWQWRLRRWFYLRLLPIYNLLIGKRWHHSFKPPRMKGWYEVRATDLRFEGGTRFRAWGNDWWWIPLADNGWLSSPPTGLYEWRGPGYDIEKSSPLHLEDRPIKPQPDKAGMWEMRERGFLQPIGPWVQILVYEDLESTFIPASGLRPLVTELVREGHYTDWRCVSDVYG